LLEPVLGELQIGLTPDVAAAVETETQLVNLIPTPGMRIAEGHVGAGAGVGRNPLRQARDEGAIAFHRNFRYAERQPVSIADRFVHLEVIPVVGIPDVAEHRVILPESIQRDVRQRLEIDDLLPDRRDQRLGNGIVGKLRIGSIGRFYDPGVGPAISR
jgi:hypothetical protein